MDLSSKLSLILSTDNLTNVHCLLVVEYCFHEITHLMTSAPNWQLRYQGSIINLVHGCNDASAVYIHHPRNGTRTRDEQL